jgi:hypothetical protein
MSKSDLKADFKKKHGHIDERLQSSHYAMPKELYQKCKDLDDFKMPNIKNFSRLGTKKRYRNI